MQKLLKISTDPVAFVRFSKQAIVGMGVATLVVAVTAIAQFFH